MKFFKKIWDLISRLRSSVVKLIFLGTLVGVCLLHFSGLSFSSKPLAYIAFLAVFWLYSNAIHYFSFRDGIGEGLDTAREVVHDFFDGVRKEMETPKKSTSVKAKA